MRCPEVQQQAEGAARLHQAVRGWLQHQPQPLVGGNVVTRALDKIAPMRTHERVLTEVKGSVFGLEVGLTLSQLELVRKDTHGVEVIQVVNPP